MTVLANRVRPVDEIRRVADEFRQHWEQKKPLDAALFRMQAPWLVDAIVQWAEKDGLGPLDEDEVIATIGFRLHPALQNFLRLVFLARVNVHQDAKYLRRQAVVTIWLPDVRRTGKPSFRNMVVMRGASPFFCCTWFHAPREDRWQIRMTGSVASLVDGEIRVGGDSLTRMRRDLMLIPGLTPLRRLAGDPTPLGSTPTREDPDYEAKLAELKSSRQQREADWLQSDECRKKLEQRERFGIDSSMFSEAWSPRLNIENGRECMEAVRALRALRAQVAATKAHEDLAEIMAKLRLGLGEEVPLPEQVLATPENFPAFKKRLQKIRTILEPKRVLHVAGNLTWPTFLLSYAPGHVPPGIQGQTYPDSLTPGRQVFPVSGLSAAGGASLINGGKLLVDFIELAKWRCQWFHKGRTADAVAYDIHTEGGGWQVIYHGEKEPTFVKDEDFATARWAVKPQVIGRQHSIRQEDLMFHSQGVAYNLGDWGRKHD